MDLMSRIKATAKAANKCIVLPEGTEERTLKAADIVIGEGIARVILLGNEQEIRKLAAEWGLKNIEKATIIDPLDNPKKEAYAQMLCEIRKSKGMQMPEALKLVEDPLYLGTLIIKNKEADGEVAGARNATGDVLRPAFSAEDILKNADQGYISALLTVEDGIGIGGRMERLDEMYRDGVRMLALTWNFENCIGFPNSDEPERHQKGLKPFGFEIINRMNSLGMIIDVSHLSEGGFWDVVRTSRKPFVASHSCARSLRNHQRNLTDDQLKAIADCGGMVGINFCSAFLSEDLRNTYAKDIVRHILHFYNTAGIDAIGWGSDFDGIESCLDFKDYTGMPVLLDLLSEHFSDDQLDKINFGNFLRVFREQE